MERLGRRPWLLLFGTLAALEAVRLAVDPRPLDLLVLAVTALAGAAALRDRGRAPGAEGPRRTETEAFARMLRGLARSGSPDAVLDAIVEELGAGTGADHVTLVRRRPDARQLEAVLVPTRPGAPASRTTLPLAELEDPVDAHRRTRQAYPVPAGAAASPGTAGDAAAGPAGAVPDARLVPERLEAEGADQRIADRIAGRIREAYGLRQVLAAPLRIDGRVEGAIVLSRRTPAPWSPAAQRLLAAAAVEAAAALARVYSLREAEARATTDALTGLPNRRAFDEHVAQLARRRRAEDRVGVLMVDIDRFKDLNDTLGHAVGDHVLREVAQALAIAVREVDVPARYGGEEFAVLLRNPSLGTAVDIGERIRRTVGALDLGALGVPPVSVSVGAAVDQGPDEPLAEVIERADQAMYRAKRAGRDRVVAA